MIKKIISSGQTEADRAALDIAIKLRISHGGCTPKGWNTDIGALSEKYKLKEMPTDNFSECIKQNVIDSVGTLIISYGSLTGDLDYARKMALRYKRQMLSIDLNQMDIAKGALLLNDWIHLYRIDVLHVIGPDAKMNPHVRNQTKHIIESALTM
jgi:hypothetical protein